MSHPQPPQVPPQAPQQPYPPQYAQYQQVQPANSTTAIVGMSLAIAGLIFTFAFIPLGILLNISGFIVSLVGNSQIKKSNGTLGGKGFAIAGIIISIIAGVIATVILLFVGALFAAVLGGGM